MELFDLGKYYLVLSEDSELNLSVSNTRWLHEFAGCRDFINTKRVNTGERISLCNPMNYETGETCTTWTVIKILNIYEKLRISDVNNARGKRPLFIFIGL